MQTTFNIRLPESESKSVKEAAGKDSVSKFVREALEALMKEGLPDATEKEEIVKTSACLDVDFAKEAKRMADKAGISMEKMIMKAIRKALKNRSPI